MAAASTPSHSNGLSKQVNIVNGNWRCLAEFGETVWAILPNKVGKVDSRWREVAWIGKAEGSDEHLCGAADGVRRDHYIRRQPVAG